MSKTNYATGGYTTRSITGRATENNGYYLSNRIDDLSVITDGSISSPHTNAINSIWCNSKDHIRYDTPIHIVEKDNKKIMLYELIGLSEDVLKIDVEFVNKTKTTYLNITGKFVDEFTGWKNNINIHEKIDTYIYDGYSVLVKDGVLTVILHEIVKEEPVFERL